MDLPEMPSRQLGRCGIRVPAVGVGCWAIGGPDHNLGLPMGWTSGSDPRESLAGLETAYAMGARLFDTADVYGHGISERLIGRLVDRAERRSLTISTKVGYFRGTAEHAYSPGHIRRQLDQSLENLHTDYIDIYFLHHSDFGPDDRWLEPVAATMRDLKARGTVRAIGMRGPHRYAPERVQTGARTDKRAQFRRALAAIEPDVLAVRDNLLTPSEYGQEVYRLARVHGLGVLINKPLSQGLLTGAYDPMSERQFGAGDHRARKRWFTPVAVAAIDRGLQRIRQELHLTDSAELVSLALWACLARYEHAAVLVGFTTGRQVAANLTAARCRPSQDDIEVARTIMAEVQAELDRSGEVFLAGGRTDTP